MIRNLALLMLAGMAVLTMGTAAQAAYPDRTITLVAPYAAGGGFDGVARILAEALARSLGQTVIVQNVGGAGGVIGSQKVAQSAPDGYTLLLQHTGLATTPLLVKNLPFDPLRSFAFVGLFAHTPMLLVGSTSLPTTNMPQLVAYIQKNPEKVTIASSGVGSATDLCAMLFEQAIGTKITDVQYKGAGPALIDLEAARVDLLCETPFGLVPHVRAGKIQALLLTGDKLLESLPNVPTAAQAGLKELAPATIWYGLYAPANTPGPIIERLSAALQAAVRDPVVIKRLGVFSISPFEADRATPDALRQQLSSQIKLWQEVFQKAGIKSE
jgi:tripartite-type tricarboxylate transporter receptor subunit TctC